MKIDDFHSTSVRTPMTDLRELRVSISDFEVKKIIGRGHFGEVKVVKEKATGEVFAMKVDALLIIFPKIQLIKKKIITNYFCFKEGVCSIHVAFMFTDSP